MDIQTIDLLSANVFLYINKKLVSMPPYFFLQQQQNNLLRVEKIIPLFSKTHGELKVQVNIKKNINNN